jgi:hypothetical protein
MPLAARLVEAKRLSGTVIPAPRFTEVAGRSDAEPFGSQRLQMKRLST